MDRQVEVVAGTHVVLRAAGAVILVAHRERGALTPDSRAMIAGRALADLVVEATEQAPDGPGRLVARQATRWLMKEAERISPGVPVEFGILCAAETDGVALFLHGSVTAVLAGQAVEYYRGSDAAFTVDRVAAHPTRAAALFVEDAKRRVPELPERGIGSLVTGIAQAAGAIVWFEGEPARTWQPRRPVEHRTEADMHSTRPETQTHAEPWPTPAEPESTWAELEFTQAEPPPPTAAFDPEPERIPLDPNLTPTRTSNRIPVDLDRDFESSSGPADYDDTAESEAATAGYDPHRAPTEMGGTNPAPKPDPGLQRRLEATAKATMLSVKVLGFKCARAHPSDPRSAFCSVCGMPVDQTQPVAEVIRPPLGMLILDDGLTYMLATDAVAGRDPEQSEAARAGLAPLKIDDSSGGMSRAHAEIRLVNWDVTVVDRGSTNGTRVRPPGYRDWIRLQPNQPMLLVPGAEVMLGNRVLRLEPIAPPPFG